MCTHFHLKYCFLSMSLQFGYVPVYFLTHNYFRALYIHFVDQFEVEAFVFDNNASYGNDMAIWMLHQHRVCLPQSLLVLLLYCFKFLRWPSWDSNIYQICICKQHMFHTYLPPTCRHPIACMYQIVCLSSIGGTPWYDVS